MTPNLRGSHGPQCPCHTSVTPTIAGTHSITPSFASSTLHSHFGLLCKLKQAVEKVAMATFDFVSRGSASRVYGRCRLISLGNCLFHIEDSQRLRLCAIVKTGVFNTIRGGIRGAI